ncbi:hypothetical protein EVAR_2488_1 [Eumeta japonica]|uniref:Uncharacterized protein n=1 Tax=Eumeta variegata TaxID=151549 RepID=A0A4C1SPC3_EUMVA|nr:hypothetical protein EVAR_2488_1 [Eumeta japonica]
MMLYVNRKRHELKYNSTKVGISSPKRSAETRFRGACQIFENIHKESFYTFGQLKEKQFVKAILIRYHEILLFQRRKGKPSPMNSIPLRCISYSLPRNWQRTGGFVVGAGVVEAAVVAAVVDPPGLGVVDSGRVRRTRDAA